MPTPGPVASPAYDVAPSFELAPVERLFCELVAIDSPLLGERAMADRVRVELERIDFAVTEDETAGANDGMVTTMMASRRIRHMLPGMLFEELRHIRLQHTGSIAGNLFATLLGTGEPLLFLTHLDTVQPALGERAQIHADGRITLSGDTVLGTEDLEVCGVAHRPVELCCMVAEEIGNAGARAFDFAQCRASVAHTLDYSGDPNQFAYQAPRSSTSRRHRGRLAHAGFEPEKGVSTVKIAVEVIDHVDTGASTPRPPSTSASFRVARA